tara:strand:- start:402 stop:647 length:246 start_codon:yes stop_codon:yes gene_type:complete
MYRQILFKPLVRFDFIDRLNEMFVLAAHASALWVLKFGRKVLALKNSGERATEYPVRRNQRGAGELNCSSKVGHNQFSKFL